MKVRCIQTSSTYWGTMFQEGNFYTIEKIENKEYKMIDRHDEYMDSIRSVTSLIPQLTEELRKKKENPDYIINPELIKLQDYRVKHSDSFKFSVSIPIAHIKDEFESPHTYCMLNKQQLQEKYNSIHFDSTLHIFDEYFETISEARNKTTSYHDDKILL